MHRSGSILVLVLSTLATSIWLTGCSPVEKTLNVLIGGGEEQQSTTDAKPGVVKIQPVERPGNPTGSQVSPQSSSISNQAPLGSPPVNGEGKIQVMLYYAAKDGTQLVQESRQVVKVPGMARRTVEELLKGPAPGSGLINTIPAGTQLLDINLKPDGLAIVNLSRELKNSHSGGSSGETMTVYSIVNTLAQFPTVQRVQILVEGEVVDTLAGHLDIAKPLEPDYSPIKQNLP